MADERKSKVTSFNYGNDQYVKDAGSVSLFTALGTKDEVEVISGIGDGVSITRSKASNIRTPGICRVEYEFIPGVSKDGSSAINLASKKLYTFVRHMNSGSRNYDSPDLMMYVYSVISANAFIAQATRVYGIIKKYSCKNRYLAKALVTALGFDYDNISLNLADFRAVINIAIAKLNALKVPDTWTVWTKQWYLNSCVIKDGDVDKSQLYVFRMRHMWQYNETGTYVGSLTPVDLYASNITINSFTTLINTVINALVASEDINIMSGDILKAYGEEKCLESPLISDDYEVTPIYDRTLLEIIHNTAAYNMAYTYNATAGFIIRQNSSGDILFEPAIPASQLIIDVDSNNKIHVEGLYDYIDFTRDDVTPNDVVQASIMKVLHTYDQGGNPVLEDAGTEVATSVTYFAFQQNTGSLVSVVSRRYLVEYTDLSDPTFTTDDEWIAMRNSINQHLMISKFDWAPMNWYANYALGVHVADAIVVSQYDLYNYTVVSYSDLKKLHELHVMGGFGLTD